MPRVKQHTSSDWSYSVVELSGLIYRFMVVLGLRRHEFYLLQSSNGITKLFEILHSLSIQIFKLFTAHHVRLAMSRLKLPGSKFFYSEETSREFILIVISHKIRIMFVKHKSYLHVQFPVLSKKSLKVSETCLWSRTHLYSI